MSVGIFFPHPLSGSLGSTRRVKEISATLATRLDVQVNLYTPYERDGFLTKRVALKSIPNLALSLGLNDSVYRSSRVLYYNRYLARYLLTSIAKNSTKLLSGKLVEIMKRDKVSVLQVEQDVSLPPAIVAARRFGIPVIADLHNIAAEELVAAGVVKKGDNTYKKLQDFVRECLSQVDYVCVVNEYMAEYVFSEYGIERNRVVVVPPAARIRTRRFAKEKSNHKVVYSGMVAYREHVDLYVKSICCVKSSTKAEFFITNKGDDLHKIRKMAKMAGAKLNFFWFPNDRDFFNFLSTCSVGVLPSKNDEARKLGTPIKLFDYMSVGLPIVANDVGSWSNIIKDERIGILTQDDPVQFCSAIKALLENNELRTEMSANSLKAVNDKYNWSRSIEPLAQIYEKLIPNRELSPKLDECKDKSLVSGL